MISISNTYDEQLENEIKCTVAFIMTPKISRVLGNHFNKDWCVGCVY